MHKLVFAGLLLTTGALFAAPLSVMVGADHTNNVYVVGFVDTTCPPPAVYSAYNVIGSSDKDIYNGFGMGHATFGWISRAMGDWERRKD